MCDIKCIKPFCDMNKSNPSHYESVQFLLAIHFGIKPITLSYFLLLQFINDIRITYTRLWSCEWMVINCCKNRTTCTFFFCHNTCKWCRIQYLFCLLSRSSDNSFLVQISHLLLSLSEQAVTSNISAIAI